MNHGRFESIACLTASNWRSKRIWTNVRCAEICHLTECGANCRYLETVLCSVAAVAQSEAVVVAGARMIEFRSLRWAGKKEIKQLYVVMSQADLSLRRICGTTKGAHTRVSMT